MNNTETVHKPVLLQEIITSLNLSEGQVLFDGTFGGGGHSTALLEKIKGLRVIAVDQDKSAIERFNNKFKDKKYNISFYNENFRKIDQILQKENIKKIDAILLDLGISSDQLENSARGFSFMKDESLLMTMKKNPKKDDLTAYEIVNTWGEDSLAKIIYGYGEEKFANRIARRIVEEREIKEIKTTKDLVAIIESAIPKKFRNKKIHPATKTFQALRIAVNDELGALKEGLEKGFEFLKKGGRMSVISFHSLEDRIVKRFYKEKEKEGTVVLINKKPIIANTEELKINNRSRSAKLRVLEKNI